MKTYFFLTTCLLFLLTDWAQANTTATKDTSTHKQHKILQGVVLHATTSHSFRESGDVARMPLSNLDNPQSYSVISRQTAQQQVQLDFEQVLLNAAGVGKIWSATGRGDFGASYFSLRGFSVQPLMRNGVAGVTNAVVDMSNIERIEVIRGPSSTLFGSSLISYGGLINVVTKKAEKNFSGNFSYNVGSYDFSKLNTHRVTFDINMPFSPSDPAKVYFRINGAFTDNKAFQDAGFNTNIFVAPALAIYASPRLTIHIDASLAWTRQTSPSMFQLSWGRDYVAHRPSDLGIDFRNKSFLDNNIYMTDSTVNVHTQVEYKLNTRWNLQTNMSYSYARANGLYAQLSVDFLSADDKINQIVSPQRSLNSAVQIQQNLVGDTKIGRMRLQSLFGLDYFYTSRQANHTSTINPSPFYIVDVVSTQSGGSPSFNRVQAEETIRRENPSRIPPILQRGLTNTYAAYASEILHLTPRLLINVGLRLDIFDNRGVIDEHTGVRTGKFTQVGLSPKAGVIYQLVAGQLSLFANYMNGLKNVAPIVQALPDISGVLKAERAEQWEAGVKWEPTKVPLSMTLSYYRIGVRNRTRQTAVERGGQTFGITVQDGRLRSEGVEWELVARPLAGLSIIAGYAFNHSVYLQADKDVIGRRPIEAGAPHTANFWAHYTLPVSVIRGIGFGFGARYASENRIGNMLSTGVFTLPQYVVMNAVVSYERKQYRVAFKVDNISNTTYFTGYASVQMNPPRSYLVSVMWRFMYKNGFADIIKKQMKSKGMY